MESDFRPIDQICAYLRRNKFASQSIGSNWLVGWLLRDARNKPVTSNPRERIYLLLKKPTATNCEFLHQRQSVGHNQANLHIIENSTATLRGSGSRKCVSAVKLLLLDTNVAPAPASLVGCSQWLGTVRRRRMNGTWMKGTCM